MARIVALLVVAVLAAAPAAALAEVPPPDPTQSPFQQAPQQNQIGETPLETRAPQQTQVDDGSIGGREGVLIGIGIVVLIGGIWFVIARDAKRATGGRVPAADSSFGASPTRAAHRSRRLSSAERKRRKRGRAAK